MSLDPCIAEDDGRPALVVGGVVQSVEPIAGELGYWGAMVPDVRPRAALLLGLGAGTVAHLLTRRFGPLPIVGVDENERAVAIGQAELGLTLPHLEVVIADAFAFVAGCRRRFGYIGVDLYRGAVMPHGVLARPFLRRLAALLEPPGIVVFNLFASRRLPEQVHRLERVFRVVRRVAVHKNVVVHARVR